jgi:S1-C subfamily serine protease
MGRVIRRDKTRDLALVQLDRLGDHARPLELAETGVRETVLHIGSGSGPLFPMTVRKVVPVDAPAGPGPVAGAAEQIPARTITLSGATDDSGGPLVDREGKLAGVVAGAGTGPSDRNDTRAIDMAEVRAFLADKDKETPAPPAAPDTREPDPSADVTVRDFGPPIDPKDLDKAAKDLYERCVKSTVFIITPVKGGYGMGSGSLIDAEKRYALTTYRTVEEESTVFVQFPEWTEDGLVMTDKKKYVERVPVGRAIKGKVLYRDKARDLALVQLDRLPTHAKAIPLAKKSARVGETVINIGTPGRFNTTFSVTQGSVRAVGVEKFLVGGSTPDSVFEVRAKVLTTTNPILPGDSGGPVIDRRGYQVAVTESGNSAQIMSHCIDVTEVWAFLNEKKVVIKDLTDGKDEPKKDPKSGDIPPAKEKGAERPPKSDRPPGSAPSAADEKAAADLLKRAAIFANIPDDKDYYMGRLREIIKKYPGTAAAKEAQKKLNDSR